MRRALALLGLVALVFGCSSDRRSTTVTSTTSVASAVGPAVDLGEGVVVGVHPSLPIAYVSAIDRTAGNVGCEGGDLSLLWARSPDAQGDRRRALPGLSASGAVIGGGADSAVAVVDQCEGSLGELGVGVPDSIGVLNAYRKVRPSTEGLQGELVPSTIGWAANGRSFIAVVKVVQPDDSVAKRPDTIVRVGLDGSVVKLATAIGVIAAVELGDGRLVRASNETVRVGDEPTMKVAVASLSIAPDRKQIAVFGDDGVFLLVPGSPLRKLAGAAATVGTWSPDGRSLAYLRLSGDAAAVDLLDIASRKVIEVAPRGGFTAPLFTSDGETLLYSRPVGDQDEIRATARHLIAVSSRRPG